MRTRCRSDRGASGLWPGSARSSGCALGISSLVLLAATAAAHVAPSVNDNNRYLTLALYGDRVRLAYTVFFGERPGAAQRRTIDADRDGQLSRAETDAFVARLGADLAPHLQLIIDGVEVPLGPLHGSFGSTSAATAAGAFSVDLVTSACLVPAAAHQLTLHDRFAVPHPGETEVHVDDGPGITLRRVAIGELRASQQRFRFAGPTPQLGEPGLQVELAVAADAPIPRDGRCAAAAATAGRARLARWWLGLATASLAAAGAVWYWRWRRGARRESATPS